MRGSGIFLSAWVVGFLALGIMISSILSHKAIVIEVEGMIKPIVTYHNSVGSVMMNQVFQQSSLRNVCIQNTEGLELSANDLVVDGQVYSVKKRNHFVFSNERTLIKISSFTSDKRDIARKSGIAIGEYDRFESIEDPNSPGIMIDRIVRVNHRLVDEFEDVPYELIYQDSNRIDKGKIVIWKPGSGGEIKRTYKQIFEDGELISKELVSETYSKYPIHQVVAEGQAELPAGYLEERIMESTAYTPTVEECDGNPDICATGMKSGYGVVAVYPNEIPYYTKMYIEGYGYAIAGDCGGAIGPGRIDVFFYDKQSAIAWGRREVKVYVLEWPERIEE